MAQISASSFKSTHRGFVLRAADGTEHLVAAPLKVISEAKTPDRTDWSLLVRFTARDGARQECLIPRKDLIRPDILLSGLLDIGYDVMDVRLARQYLPNWLASARPKRQTLLVRQGWHEKRFVLPRTTLGDGSVELQLRPDLRAHAPRFDRAGTLKGWQQEVASLCRYSDHMVLAICAAFSGPLLHLTGTESGGFHFAGNSSTGKTLTKKVAASLAGPPSDEGLLRSWNTTLAALEETALAHSDTFLCLDELKLIHPDPKEAAKIASQSCYTLSNGSVRKRSKRWADLGVPVGAETWRIVVLSSGELSLSAHAESGGQERFAGEQARIIDVPVGESELGVFRRLPSAFKTASALARAIESAVQHNHGYPFRSYLRKLQKSVAADEEAVRTKLRKWIEDALSHFGANPNRAFEIRIARRFALAYAAGQLAIEYGVLPWKRATVSNAIKRCYWAAAGSKPPSLSDQVVETIRKRVLAEPNLLDLTATTKVAKGRLDTASGYILPSKKGRMVAVPPKIIDQWLTGVCAGKRGRKLLDQAGLILLARSRLRTQQIKISGIKGRRSYVCLDAAKLGL